MFVPRALRLKGVREPKRVRKPTAHAHVDEVAATLEKTSISHSSPQSRQIDSKKAFSGPRFTTPPITPEFLEKLLCGIELLFTDYAHQDKDRLAWLEKHYRVVDGEEKFIHLSAILEHPNISTLKPEATQLLLRQAIERQITNTLELAKNGYFVRRRPSTFPLCFIPKDSFSVFNDDGLSFWDQRTIYVEPHTRDLCKTPARVAQWLKAHGQMKEKWFPIQAVHKLFNSCAFVVLSGNVTHEDIWQKWRELDKPECWKIMTKVEHTKRTNEYLALLRKEKPWLKIKGVDAMPVEEAPKPTAEESVPTVPIATTNRKRKHNKSKRSGMSTDKPGAESTEFTAAVNEEGSHVDPTNEEGVTIETEELDHGPSNKKAKLGE
ncbi:hypothetical protein K505DRAFT_275789 [Melanomma pulvis-pyrius CBS 109.77]|uniref:Uncharacterized protein n=1 Tax=Melanomma pulvis-pyrius CBS 109.77 TaxID=1314802 RepID=A0A6A6XCC2_9PLEO|nr:hypothetical protein K505DRAFT_275789 [Melanomma pulvis-pyrius CBS 109.77]